MAEGAPLLRAYRRNLIEGSNPSLSAIIKNPTEVGFFLSVNRVALTPKRRTATELFRP